MNSSCRTLEPSDADLFLVPDYRACHFHLTPKPTGGQGLTVGDDGIHSAVVVNHFDKTRNISDADNIWSELLGNLEPWFSRKQGRDHVFIFSDQGFVVNFTHTFPNWRERIPHSIFLTTEAFTPGCGPSCFSPWKDIVIML